jgi:hypothetical protein
MSGSGRSTSPAGPASRIVDIALLPQYCNRGIGTTLLRDLQSEAAAAGKPLRIHVERFNPALRLYQRLGFTLQSSCLWTVKQRCGSSSLRQWPGAVNLAQVPVTGAERQVAGLRAISTMRQSENPTRGR